jgi:uncharacterized membrane protein (UPF0127 family)
MLNKLNTPSFYFRRFGLWGLVLSLHGALFTTFLGAPEFSFGIWEQSEPILIGLHFCAALAAISLGMIAFTTKRLGFLAWHPIVLLPLGLAFWSFLVGFTHDLPSLSWFGSPEVGEGILWYLELALLTAAAGIVIKFRFARLFLAFAAIFVTCILTFLTIRYFNTGNPLLVPFRFSDYLGFSGIFIITVALTYLRETKLLILITAIIAGLFIVYFSSNRAAWGLVYIATPVIGLIGFFIARRVPTKVLRLLGAINIFLFIVFSTTLLSTVDFRPLVKKIELTMSPGSNEVSKFHSAISSQLTRQHLHTLSLEAIEDRPMLLALGRGWGMFGDLFASYLPIDWVTLRDDKMTMSESDNWILKGHWDAVGRVDFHSHNGFLQAILSTGIIGCLLFLGIFLAPLIWCRKKFIILAGAFGFATTALYTQWFQMPSSLPLFAFALGGFITPTKFRWFYPMLKRFAPYVWTAISVLLIFIGLVSLKFTPYAFYYMPQMTKSLTTPEGYFICPNRFEDQGRGGIHLAHRLRSMSRYVKTKILSSEDPNFDGKEFLLDYFRGVVCASENYIDRGASIRLLIAALNTRSDFAFLNIPNKMKPMVNKYKQNWGKRVTELVTRAPKRTDMAATYLLYLLKIGDEKTFSNFAIDLYARNPEDSIALWFSGIALLSKPNMGYAGTQRMRKALRIGVERLIPVDQSLKSQLMPEDPGLVGNKIKLTIKTKNGLVPIAVELAKTERARKYGLMGKTSLSTDSGLLLVFPEVQNVNIWMKDTYFPLDLLFIDSTGKIKKIVKGTTPFSLKIIESDEMVKAVLEVNAGFVQNFGIQTGDSIGPLNIFN